LYESDGKFDIYLSKLELITQNLTVKNAILILRGDWYINFPHKCKNMNGNYTIILRNSLKNTVNVLTKITKSI